MRAMYAFFLVVLCTALVSCSKKSDDANPVDGGGTPPPSVSARVQFTMNGPDISNKTFTANLARNSYTFAYEYDEEDNTSGLYLVSPDLVFGGGFKGKSPGVYTLNPENEVVLTITVQVDGVALTGLYSTSGVLTIYEIDAKNNKIRGEFSGEFRGLNGAVYQVTKGSFSIN